MALRRALFVLRRSNPKPVLSRTTCTPRGCAAPACAKQRRRARRISWSRARHCPRFPHLNRTTILPLLGSAPTSLNCSSPSLCER
ncbi:hypothetical protein CALCODRAFT_224379 [Calocera cornea HHB12733]|uniref:Uncharacterized protein n=1 Tax=Calocera cornea HHB12733 TaxID=1353952 RepID=A0A165H5X2_9BASI|nr:hypothetical protein CALCODRAFT_224379 [Calocera cornea HHB12733]